jgi:hypothetical protein
MAPAALAALMGLGAWTFLHRRADLWLLLGVAAVVARLWTYHFVYDDVLILLPMLALYRLARAGPGPGNTDLAAGLLFAAGLGLALAPARMLNMGWPLDFAYEAAQAALWLAMLAFLGWQAARANAPQPGLATARAHIPPR